jgi:RNA polymerase sigma factor (sigma-70 family)
MLCKRYFSGCYGISWSKARTRTCEPGYFVWRTIFPWTSTGPNGAPNPEQKITLEERKRQFEDAFARLTPKQRHCVTLRAAGMRYRAIAQAMGVSHQRVGELMKRAIALLNAGT